MSRRSYPINWPRGIAGGAAEGLKRLFLSHPPLEERIAALRAGKSG